jgi:hypothetical protein
MTTCPDLQHYVLTEHARWEMQRRDVTETEVAMVLQTPGQREEVRLGRCVYQSRLRFRESSTEYLVRVFVDVDRTPAEVVTVYRTSKVAKYWR